MEAHRLDKIEQAIDRTPNKGMLIAHIFQVSQTLILSRQFRLKVLEVLVRVHTTIPDPEYVAICQCLQFLNRASEVAQILDDLIKGPEEKALLSYQVAFDLVESENQHFLLDVNTVLFSSSPAQAPPPEAGSEEAKSSTAAEAKVGVMFSFKVEPCNFHETLKVLCILQTGGGGP